MTSAPALLDGYGAPAREVTRLEPPNHERDRNCQFFGWFDIGGDPNTVRFDAIRCLLRDSKSGRFVILVEGSAVALSITDLDAERLMARMGWRIKRD